MSDDSAKKRRSNLYKKDPHCFWCQREVIYYHPQPGENLPPNFATLDHLNDRIDYPRRPYAKTQITRVLACRSCNEGRARDKLKKLNGQI